MEGSSLDRYLGSLESEELLGLDRALRELEAHPGWAVYTKLVDVQEARSLTELTARPLNTVQAYAFSGGFVKGLRAGSRIIEKVHDTARAVASKLESAGAAGGEA